LKLFFTLDTLLNAGTEKSTLETINNISKTHEVTVIYFYPRHDLKSAFEQAGIKLFFFDLKGKSSFFQGIKKLSSLLKKEKPDLVISSLFRANIISRIACKLTGIKLIGTFVSDSYSPSRIEVFNFKRKMGSKFVFFIDRITSGIPKRWISNSISIKNNNCRLLEINPDKVTVIYRGRNSLLFRQHDYFFQGTEFKFCFIGRLLESKGLNELINAFSLICSEFPFIKLEIYGEGNYRDSIISSINNLGIGNKVNFHGSITDAWKKLYDCNCFVFPSWYEGFSGSLIEAMMTGIPIVASDIPMNLEAVSENNTALIYQVKNVKDLASKMRQMIINYPLMIEMGQRARMEAIQRFDIKVIASKYEAFLNEVISDQYS